MIEVVDVMLQVFGDLEFVVVCFDDDYFSWNFFEVLLCQVELGGFCFVDVLVFCWMDDGCVELIEIDCDDFVLVGFGLDLFGFICEDDVYYFVFVIVVGFCVVLFLVEFIWVEWFFYDIDYCEDCVFVIQMIFVFVVNVFFVFVLCWL